MVPTSDFFAGIRGRKLVMSDAKKSDPVNTAQERVLLQPRGEGLRMEKELDYVTC